MSRSQIDQFIDDDEEETCPLCVEEFDLTDKGFRPCPCGYQICQFCYHNVKTNMNGLCPACRRPYRDEDIEYKVITTEETAAHKARQAQKQKKTQAALQKEKQKAEADNLSRKHLAGLRVVQKNLVYVTGLSPSSQEDQLLQTLRGDQYFGQYGRIIKIVVSKAKDPAYPQSVGVYVTYEQKEDAANCIAAVDGSKNGERTLRAQFGTTKYCSAYLRGETCSNRNCMFLHEPGEANESYSRADLSALNAGSSQQGTNRPPPPQSQQPVASASASHPMMRQISNDQPSSPTMDRPALPSTASWASKPAQLSRTDTRPAAMIVESPAPVLIKPVDTQVEQQSVPEQPAVPSLQDSTSSSDSPRDPKTVRRSQISPLISVFKGFTLGGFKLIWSPTSVSQTDLDMINNYPPLFDSTGGARRRLRRQREEEHRRLAQEVQAFQEQSTADPEESHELSAGSLQLGGEPEDNPSLNHLSGAIHPPVQEGELDAQFRFGGVASPGASDRGLTPQQHQQMLLQTLKPNAQGAYSNNNVGQTTALPSSLQQQHNNPPGHQRNVSRFSFANDSGSASAAVKPVANQKLMHQQSSMMPPAGNNHFGAQYQQPHGQFYTSNVQGPPPGLKTTGTPPVSGNVQFGQGHGFATGGLQYGAGTSRNQQDIYYKELLRGGDGSARGVDAKRGGAVDVADSSTNHVLQARMHQGAGSLGGGNFAGQAGNASDDSESLPFRTPTRQHSIASRVSHEETRRSTPPVPPGFEGQAAHESRRATPTILPGLSKPNALPDLDDNSSSRPTSRPSSRASVRRTASQVLPAIPLRPSTPVRPSTPLRQTVKEDASIGAEETPTRQPRGVALSNLDPAVSANRIAKDTTQAQKSYSRGPNAPPERSRAETNVVATTYHIVGEGIQTTPRPDVLPTAPKSRSGEEEAISRVGAAESGSVAPSFPESIAVQPSKRKHPGKLSITAAVLSASPVSTTSTPIDVITPSKSQRSVSQTPSLNSRVPESPSGSASSPAIKTAPRTIRVVQTPKTETPSFVSSATSTMSTTAAHKLPSRKASVASINIPGTPSSEQVSISDNISLASTSLSRANSPPPLANKVGSASIRAKTKSQMKKERQERAKAIEEEKAKLEDAPNPGAEEPAQEAIVARKKKTKKEKEAKGKARASATTSDTTPSISRSTSPVNKHRPTRPLNVDSTVLEPQEVQMPTPVEAPQLLPQLPKQAPRHVASELSPPATPTLTAAQVIADLKTSAPHIQKCIDSLFRVSNHTQTRPSQGMSAKNLANPTNWKPDFKVNLSKEDVDALLKGKTPAIHYGGEDGRSWDRGMVTPSGAHLRALTQELESRFLELEKALRDMPEELRFRPSKPQNEMKLPSIDLEALKRQFENAGGRGPSAMEQMVREGSTMKKGAFLVDGPSKYINEFVIPPAAVLPAGGPGRGQMATSATASAAAGTANQASTLGGEPIMHSVDVAERQLHEARRYADEKESALRKIIKKNKRVLGLS